MLHFFFVVVVVAVLLIYVYAGDVLILHVDHGVNASDSARHENKNN